MTVLTVWHVEFKPIRMRSARTHARHVPKRGPLSEAPDQALLGTAMCPIAGCTALREVAPAPPTVLSETAPMGIGGATLIKASVWAQRVSNGATRIFSLGPGYKSWRTSGYQEVEMQQARSLPVPRWLLRMLLPWGVVPAIRIVLLGPNIAQHPIQTMEGLVFMSARLVLTPLATRVLAMATQLMRIAVAATVNGVALTLPWVQERWSRR